MYTCFERTLWPQRNSIRTLTFNIFMKFSDCEPREMTTPYPQVVHDGTGWRCWNWAVGGAPDHWLVICLSRNQRTNHCDLLHACTFLRKHIQTNSLRLPLISYVLAFIRTGVAVHWTHFRKDNLIKIHIGVVINFRFMYVYMYVAQNIQNEIYMMKQVRSVGLVGDLYHNKTQNSACANRSWLDW